jgi:hypothetical protein
MASGQPLSEFVRDDMTWRKNGLVFAILLGVLVTLWLRFQPFSPDESGYRVELDLASTAGGSTWFQYDSGDGWNYRQRLTVWVQQSAQPKTYRVALPSGVFHAFSIVSQTDIQQVLAGARIVAPDGTPVARIPAIQPAPGSNKIVIRLSKPLELIAPDSKSWTESVVDFVLCTGVVFLLIWLLQRRGGVALQERLRGAVAAFVAWTSARPRVTLFGVAALAVAASCHPVVFFGKSFVSPNNGILCLYDIHPTLPGAPAGPIDQWSGSDINATMWEHLPYSVIAHDSIFHDHELPLWDRYGMCGLTLVGQGMSMIGDPLYLMTVLADGAAWAWDLRFLVSKLLFVLGLGLVVWRCTRHLGVAAMLAFSCAFISYFSFRFNHPAFFGVCYAPWMLLCWLAIAEARSLRGAGWGALALLAANWVEFNSGTAKEATMLMVGLNGFGALAVLFQAEPWKVRFQKLVPAGLSCIAFLAIASPLWVTFLDALKSGYTLYDTPRSNQLAPALLIGLFDDLFYRQLMDQELHVDPALNFFVLLGVCWALADLRKWLQNPTGKAAFVVAGVALALAFAVIPPSLLDRVPFLQNILHVDNTFICVSIVPLFVVAGFGFRSCLEKLGTPDAWRNAWLRTLLIIGALAALYFGTAQAVPATPDFALQLAHKAIFSPFFVGYALALFTAVAVLPWLANGMLLNRGPFAAQILALALCLGILHFRHSQWLQTKFDYYVVNPQQRVDLQASSPAVQFVRAHQNEPGRVMGFGQILRPGFNILYRLECTTGVDAVAMQTLAAWYEGAGLGTISLWWPTVTKANLADSRRVYDAMNVRFYLGSADDAERPAPGLEKIASADLDVFESKSAWPRAFFTDRLIQYRDVRALLHWVKEGDGQPFAAALAGEANLPSLSPDQASRHIVPARDYQLTSNTTSFTLEAPTAGIAVLNESFVQKNFRAYLNGQLVPCFRVNHIFKGIALPGPGTFHVKFVYWPHALTTALWVALGGLIAVLMAVALLLFRPALLAAEFQTPPPPETARDHGV